MSSLKVFLCDDHSIYREGLKLLLKQRMDICVVGEASDGAEALSLLGSAQADIALIDLSMPGMNGVELITEMRSKFKAVKIIVLSQSVQEQWLEQLIEIGIEGLVLKSDPPAEIISAIESVAREERYFTTKAAEYFYELLEKITKRETSGSQKLPAPVRLSAREKEVASFTCEGKSIKQIALLLNCSENTIKTHKANLMKKIQASSSLEVLAWVTKYQL